MKKIILMFIVVVGLSASNLTQAEKDLSGRLVKVLGYQCESVDNARRSNWDGSITVYCDDYSYSYVVKKVGGHWTIKVK